MYTHYSLFRTLSGCTVLDDFKPLPSGGIHEILKEIHANNQTSISSACVYGRIELHPNGEQINMIFNNHTLILFTQKACQEHGIELRGEGNIESAKLAEDAAASASPS